MSEETKPIVSKEEVFDKLDIRVGRVLSVAVAEGTPKPAYVIRADFGRFGVRTSVGRFTQHAPEELMDRFILGVLNFKPRQIGTTVSEFLTLGVQYPKADSGEATLITTMANVKIGSKLF